MGFTYQEKSGETRKHATPDPVLRKGQKEESGGRKPGIFAVARQNNSWEYGDHIDKCLILWIIIDSGKIMSASKLLPKVPLTPIFLCGI
jgi:hypothetical protein